MKPYLLMLISKTIKKQQILILIMVKKIKAEYLDELLQLICFLILL